MYAYPPHRVRSTQRTLVTEENPVMKHQQLSVSVMT